jgi:hypothetical protein
VFDKKWLKPMALAMSLPSSALVTAWGISVLVKQEVITKTTGILIFLAIVLNILISMVVYAIRNNKKD